MDNLSIQIVDAQQSIDLDKTKKLSGSGQRELELRNKSVEMEALFITQLFKSMEKTIHKEDDSGNNLSTMMFSSVMGQAAAEQGGIGLSDMIYKSLQGSDKIPAFDELKASDLYNNIKMSTIFGDLSDE